MWIICIVKQKFDEIFLKNINKSTNCDWVTDRTKNRPVAENSLLSSLIEMKVLINYFTIGHRFTNEMIKNKINFFWFLYLNEFRREKEITNKKRSHYRSMYTFKLCKSKAKLSSLLHHKVSIQPSFYVLSNVLANGTDNKRCCCEAQKQLTKWFKVYIIKFILVTISPWCQKKWTELEGRMSCFLLWQIWNHIDHPVSEHVSY